MKSQDEFLTEFNITKEVFDKTKLVWKDLESIHTDFVKRRSDYLPTAKLIADTLQQMSAVHSVKYRIKDADHLIAKVIRKKIAVPDLLITIENYSSVITDIIGVRALHLFKEDWKLIHQELDKTWDFGETPTANIRRGDSQELIDSFTGAGCRINEHSAGYRSVHYLLQSTATKKSIMCEIQVRTIFEEGWSEIDHLIRYPYNLNNTSLNRNLDLFNKYAGTADEMGSSLQHLRHDISKYENETKELKSEIVALKKEIKALLVDTQKKDELQERIDSIIEKSSKAISNYPIFSINKYLSTPMASSHDLISEVQISVFPTFSLSLCNGCGKEFVPTIFDLGYCPECTKKASAVTFGDG